MLSIATKARDMFIMPQMLPPTTHEREDLARDLHDAIQEGGLHLNYQPVFDSRSERILGVEALCRWRHPSRGDIPPLTFIPLAEDKGLISALGDFVIRQACIDALDWPGVMVAVNVSPQQFQKPEFVERIRHILLETGLAPSRLELEITENLLIEDIEDARTKMQALQSDGIRFALDDFGSGYSSLNYLLSLPFDKLKVDRSFVLRLEGGAASVAIIHAIVSIGRALGMHVTAEGIETAEQQQFLRVAGVHSFQGFRFSRPVPSEIISRMVGEERQFAKLSMHAK
ncbi:MAG: hypothetical protein CTY15_07475 [Methylocystis sp.]|nr:MAG: hypothetical protein CTY15_07475 [Methylocystis sp.]